MKTPSCEYLLNNVDSNILFYYFLLLSPSQLPILFSVREQCVSPLKRLLYTVWVMHAIVKGDKIPKKKNPLLFTSSEVCVLMS